MTGKRAYSSDLRAEQARRTRRQIVDAAGALFAEHGFHAVTIDAIAERAGVSRKTVFTAVGGKVELLKLAYDFTLAGDDEPIPMRERAALKKVIAEQDPRRQLALHAAFVTDMSSRISPLYMALRGAAEVDPEARVLYEKWELERRDAMRSGPIPRLVELGALRKDVRPAEAADILWTLIDPSIYHRLVVDGGWSKARFRGWLTRSIQEQLLEKADPPDFFTPAGLR